jgi:hypothetical protein
VSLRSRAGAIAAGAILVALGVAPSPAQEPPRPPPSIVTSLTVFAGTTEGLYRSGDWGGSWVPAATADKTHGLDGVGAVRDIVPSGPWVLLGGDGGVYRSEDFGLTWRRTETAAPVVRVLPSRYPQGDPTVFAATSSGLLKSSDGGLTFKPTALSGTAVHRLEWPGPALVAATGRGVVVSMDSGITFSDSGSGLPAGDVRALALSSFFSMDPVLFAGVGSEGVFRSGDRGRTWTPAGLDGETVTDLAWLGPFLYAVTANGLFRSEDMGRAWTPLKKGLKAAPTRVLFPLMPTSGMEVFLGTVRGVYRSPNGGTDWQPSGLEKLPVLCLATFPPPDPVRE